ncbi:MAG: hypothetical protein KGO82_19030 [Bacteroidota bacterium]|nr:hypothetical protein [Bacteroidota bacterium]
MYNVGDTSYMSQPDVMDNETVLDICEAVRLHCRKHKLRYFDFIFHGGEPLLAGKDFYRNFVDCAKASIPARTRLSFSMQTNGVLLDEDWCQLLSALHISIGISLDGDKPTNDMNRKDRGNHGTYDRTIKGLNIAIAHPYLYPHLGILSVVNVFSDAATVYNSFKSLGVQHFNLLLPYGTLNSPPPGIYPHLKKPETVYADWLIEIFDCWFDDSHRPEIRLFTSIIELLLGINNEFEYFGKSKIEYLVIEADGSIEPTGALKVCGNKFTKLGLNIRTHDLDEALREPLIRLYHLSHFILPAKCTICPIRDICGGGHLPTRFSRKNAFNNPSVYCLDYMKLITHIQQKLWQVLPEDVTAKLLKVTYREMLAFHNEYAQLRKIYGH